ncbi:hypothetical protein Tco_0227485 [Tanacetum coccineum]
MLMLATSKFLLNSSSMEESFRQPVRCRIRAECGMLKDREKVRDQECEELKAKCKEAMADFDKNPIVNVLHEKIASLFGEVKEHRANLDRMLLESQNWVGYQVSLSTLESKVASLEVEKVKLEALVNSDDMGRLVTKLFSASILYERCQEFEEVANMNEPFDIIKMKGYKSSYKYEHMRAGNELVTVTFPILVDFVTDPHAFVEVLLSKKPRVLQHPALTRTHVPAFSVPSQKITPSPALMSHLS